jgi:hypothetical protein
MLRPKTKYVLEVESEEVFSEMIQNHDIRLSRVLSETILDANRERTPDAIVVNFTDGSYAVMEFAENQEEALVMSLKDCLKDFERIEDYEMCKRILEYVNK